MSITGITKTSESYLHDLPTAVQTTDATVTTIATIAIPINRALFVKYVVMGIQSDFTNAFGGEIWCLFRRGSSGNIFQVGAIRNTINRDVSFVTCDSYFEIDNTGFNILLRLKGKAATTINWTVEMDYLIKS